MTNAYAPLLTRYAEEAYWSNTSVIIMASSDYTNEVARGPSAGKIITAMLMVFAFGGVIVATVIQICKIGEKPDEVEDEVFKSSK